MPGRTFSAGNGYRYGFNGKENDNEVKGDGNQYDYGFRIYDPRIARFLSFDPLANRFPWYTPYQFAGNKPIWSTDIDGLEDRILGDRARYDYQTLTENGVSHEDAVKAVYENSKLVSLGAITGLSMAFTFGSSSQFTIGTLLKNMSQAGAVGAVMNTTLSALKGESTRDLVKSFVTGFLGGAILGAGSGNIVTSVLMRGEFAGVVEETSSQIIEKYVLETRQSLDVNQIGFVGLVGALSNVGAKVLLDEFTKYSAKTLAVKVGELTSKEFKRILKDRLKAAGIVKGGDRALNIAANKLINGAVKEAKASAEKFNKIIAQGIERLIDGTSDPVKDKGKKAVENK